VFRFPAAIVSSSLPWRLANQFSSRDRLAEDVVVAVGLFVRVGVMFAGFLRTRPSQTAQ
jgi:hypothetical protein